MMVLHTPQHRKDDGLAQRQATLERALRTLHPVHQQVLTLKFSRRLSTSQIAALLSCSVACVQVLQHQALTELQRLIG